MMDDVDPSSGDREPSRVPSDAELAELLGDDFGGEAEHLALDGHGVLHDLSSARRKKFPQPPAVVAVPVEDVASVYGRRVVHQREDGPVYDLRAASEVFTDSSGSWIKVVREWRWYAWLATPKQSRPQICPRAIALATLNVWVEQYDRR
jgi:hypothetical protein